ncbi:tRNA (adenosine(37)-N6)-dimethylallyltransferase MiaA [Candidatus Leptofilum sp.]|uniref:tRNA (adenosine(37)-N6)-dimethylallyltransferase MiaA n=1 Tax=Candidatus Leptofilum sp. TaxID=3241576 RepID=UPI003B5A183F
MDQPLIVLLGQTAVGKTSLSLQLAQALAGEIISADSRLFYRGMDIGTAKPTPEEQVIAPHHLIDLCQPDETITLGDYQRRAYQTIDFVLANGRLPILVGGTGQYVKAVIEGWGIPEVPPHPKLRDALAQLPGPELARWLAALDSIAAAKHDPRNLRRIIRALEVTLVSGRPISELQHKIPPPYRVCQIGLTRPREELYARIDARIDQMLANGLLDELKQLRDLGYGRSLPSMSGLGYRQLWAHLDGEMSLDEAVERIKFETHRFARHQANWFRKDDPAINWFEMVEGVETAVQTYIVRWLNEGKTSNGRPAPLL